MKSNLQVWAVMVFLLMGFGMLTWGVQTSVTYQRSDWKHWIDADGDCQNTRHEVLIRDAITFQLSSDGCRVISGTWEDPYSGRIYNNPEQMHVDHFVPLENAHHSGGYAWTLAEKRAFANDLNYRWHLLAVSASENLRKGSKAPDQYRPPNREFWCQYGQAWASIKASWRLSLTESERQALRLLLSTCQ
jgi:Domain of unknown function (DUF1994).